MIWRSTAIPRPAITWAILLSLLGGQHRAVKSEWVSSRSAVLDFGHFSQPTKRRSPESAAACYEGRLRATERSKLTRWGTLGWLRDRHGVATGIFLAPLKADHRTQLYSETIQG